MNTLGIAILWCMLQVTLACVAGAVVYLVARKVGWAAGRMAVIGALTMVLVLSVAALSPWPSWFSFGRLGDKVIEMTNPMASPENGLPLTDVDAVATELPAQPDASGPLNLAFWRAVWAEMQRTEATADSRIASASNAWRWPALVAAIVLVIAAIGILRLVIAWFAVHQLDRQSINIDDTRLTQLAATISRDLSLSAPLVLKESTSLQTAATFGWRRPVILLPVTWRDWPDEELRAVLAHEMAHIRSGDFLTWLLAQFIVATHFYHPLVHWLAGRLRLEQELAADATAAQFAGGRETYLQSLATLTLRADHLRPSWATQTFLPTRSTFLRRIEMLKRTKTMSSERPSGMVRFAVLGTLVVIGVFAVGLRAPGPIGATPVVAAEPEGEKTDLSQQVAKRSQSQKNLKQIAFAFHIYHDEHGHFPPAVLYDKKTETPYSWRVAILPYIEQKALYNQYHFNELWDSENNLKIAKTIIPIFASPAEPTSTNAAYFALVGPETLFLTKVERKRYFADRKAKLRKAIEKLTAERQQGESGGQSGGYGRTGGPDVFHEIGVLAYAESQKMDVGLTFASVRDGTSITILLVEAKRDIPWTKPEDIPYSHDKPLPKLGGFFKGGFHVAFCDGFVRFVPDDIAPQTLRHLIEIADGNAVDWQAIQK